MTDEETNKKLDTLIALMTPKPENPKQDTMDKAAAIVRKALEGKFPKEKLDTWDLQRLLDAQDVANAQVLPDPLGKNDAVGNEEKPPETPPPLSKEDADREANPFKYSARTYDKEVLI